MRFKASTAGVLAAGALLFAVPAAASASTSSASPASSANTPSATSSQFAQVADGQTMAQVDQEMGSAGTLIGATTTAPGGHVDPAPAMNTEDVVWNDSSLGPLGGVLQFSVDFSAPVGQPLVVTGKTALGL